MTTKTTTPEENKKILRRWCLEVFNGKNWPSVNELLAPTYADWSRFPGQAPTLESLKDTLHMFFTAFPDCQFNDVDTIAEGDMGLIRGTWRATHTGPFMHLPPTGKELGGERIHFFRFTDGKVSEHWGTGLELDVLQLMGFNPPITPMVSDGDNRVIVHRFVEDILHQRNIAAVDALFAGYSRDILKQSLDMFILHAAFPDARVTVEHTISEGDKVAVHSTLTGTHLGTFMGVPPTGKRVAVTKIDIFHLAGGKIVESLHQWDNLGLLLQIGAIGSDDPAGGNGL